jgi:hypothetical protein
MHRKVVLFGSAIAFLIGTAIAGSTASATPPSSPGPAPDGPVLVSKLDGPLKAKANGIDYHIKGDVMVRNFVLKYPAGSNSGWHKHPGLVMASVISGSVTRTLPCKAPETFTVGDAFVEVGPHFVASSTGAELQITQIAPFGTPPADLREDLPAPIC